MPQVLGDQNDSDRGNQGHGTEVEAGGGEAGQDNPGGIVQVGEVDGFAQAEPIGEQQVDQVANDTTYQNRETPQGSGSIDGNQYDGEQRDEPHPRIKLAAADICDGHRGEDTTNSSHNSTDDGTPHQLHHP